MTIHAIIPARGGSQGIPGKNLREIGGEPLVGIAARQAIAAEEIEHVVVSSDDPAIRAAVGGYDVDVRDRPERYARGDRMMGVDTFLAWQVSQLEQEGSHVEVVVLLYPTAPLRPVDVIDETVRRVSVEGYDSALTLCQNDQYLWEVDGDIAAPTNYDPCRRGPRQMEVWNQWAENKAVYVMTRDLLMETRCRLGGAIGHISMSPLRSVDIDTPKDLELARQIAKIYGKTW